MVTEGSKEGRATVAKGISTFTSYTKKAVACGSMAGVASPALKALPAWHISIFMIMLWECWLEGAKVAGNPTESVSVISSAPAESFFILPHAISSIKQLCLLTLNSRDLDAPYSQVFYIIKGDGPAAASSGLARSRTCRSMTMHSKRYLLHLCYPHPV